jgi:hypothetical protein
MPLTPDAWIAAYHERHARIRRGDTFIFVGLACFWVGFGISHFLAGADSPGQPDSQGFTLGECQPQTQTGANE